MSCSSSVDAVYKYRRGGGLLWAGMQESQERTRGHRSCFPDEEKWDKSSLSMHVKEVHGDQFSLNNFSAFVVKKVSPTNG